MYLECKRVSKTDFVTLVLVLLLFGGIGFCVFMVFYRLSRGEWVFVTHDNVYLPAGP
jgi:hypothetical protein